MKSAIKNEKTSGHDTQPAIPQVTSAGPDGISIAPPPVYSIKSMDSASIQMSAIPSAPHEAWNSVQRKQTQQDVAAPEVIQRWEWPWNWGKKKKADPHAHFTEDERQALSVQESIERRRVAYAHERVVKKGAPDWDSATADDVENTGRYYQDFSALSREATQPSSMQSKVAKAQKGKSGVSGAGTFLTHLGQVKGNEALGETGRIVTGSGGGLGFASSLFEAGVETRDIIKSQEKKKDKAIRSIGVASPLANAVNSGASGIKQVGDLVSSNTGGLSSFASTVAAPAAIAKGSADVITGLASGGLAHYRSNRLQETENQGGKGRGIARFAKESQWTKAKSNYGKAAGGALSVAGGALLLTAGLSNPLGWALLAGAGLVGGALGLYRMYKKHQQGKKLNERGYRNQLSSGGINVPTDQELGPRKWSDLRTTSMRRQEAVREQIAARLTKDERGDRDLGAIRDHLGVRAPDQETIPFFETPEKQRKREKKRAKSYAKALDY